MTEVVYSGSYPAVVLPDGTVCVKGESVSVSDSVAKDLLKQGFKKARVNDGQDGK